MPLLRTALALAALATAAPAQEVLTETFEDGSPKVRREVRRTAEGAIVDHGPFKRWHRTGKVAEEGVYADGLRTGEWSFRWENGRRRALGEYRAGKREGDWKLFTDKGKKAAQGSYRGGIRDGKWTFWTEDRKVDETRSGVYRSHALPDGETRGWEGESKDGRREGRWTLYRTGRRPMLVGDYAAGLPEGPWVFLHADGTRVERWFTGRYEGGVRTGALTAPPAGFTGLESEPDRARVPPPGSSERFETLLEAYLTGGPDERKRARASLLAEPRAALPTVLTFLLGCNLESVREQSQARRVHADLLAEIFGAPLRWSQGTLPDDVADNTKTILHWHTLWELVAERDRIWRGELDPRWRWMAVDRSYTLVEHPPAPAGFLPEPSLAPEGIANDGRERAAADPATRAPLANALAWIASRQAPSGAWHPALQGGDDLVSTGVTSMCLLALLFDGHTPFAGEHAATVARGLEWLAKTQNPGSGALSTASLEPTYEHVVGAWALAEAAERTALPVLRQSVHRAVDYLTAVQRFDGAWSRNPAAPDGNPVVTSEALIALARARAAGVQVEDDVFQNGLDWLRKRTDRETGETAGEELGALVPHSSDAATASALLARLVAEPMSADDRLVERQVSWVAEHVPVVFPDLDESDPHYVFLGSHAAALRPGPAWEAWNAAMRKVLLASQVLRGDDAGAWDVRGRHGYAGGRLWTTALAALTLVVSR